MNYIAILISILCLQESYAVASRHTMVNDTQITNISLLSAPTTLSSYPALKANITTSSSLMQSVEGTATLQSKLQASGGYVMSKLNGESAAVLVDYAKFLKVNTGKENAFKNDNYAFDAWLKGAKSSAGTTTELTDADMSPGLVGVDGGSKELLYAKKVIAPANTLDMIIHANGSSYKFEINGSYVEGDHRTLAGWLKSKGYNTQTIRLLSCSELSSAQNLCNKLNQPVIATDGYVCIYSDGGLSVVPRTGNGDTKWYLLKPGNIRNEMASPRAPGSAGLDYVQMGGSVFNTTFYSAKSLNNVVQWLNTSTKNSQIDQIIKTWDINLLRSLNSDLNKFSSLASELENDLSKYLNFYMLSQTTWYFKYGLLREHYRTGTTFRLPLSLVSAIETLSAYDGTVLNTVNPSNRFSDYGNRFEDDLIEEMGEAIQKGNFNDFPIPINSDLTTVLSGYKVMVTQAIVDLKPYYTSAPQPDMLFFRTTATTIDSVNVIYIDAKLSPTSSYTSAQNNFIALKGTGNWYKISGYATSKNPELFINPSLPPKIQSQITFEWLNKKQFKLVTVGKISLQMQAAIINMIYTAK